MRGDDAGGDAAGLVSWVLPLVRRLATFALRSDARDFILGDLDELHQRWQERHGRRAADRRYLKALLASAAEGVLRRERVGRSEPDPPRRQRGTAVLAELWRELGLALRSLWRSPGFAVTAVLTLGLGIGATASIYTLLDAVVLRPLPYEQADRLVEVQSTVPGAGENARWGLSVAGYFHFREHARSFESLATIATGEVTVTSDTDSERVLSASVSASAFDVLRLAPAIGRPFRSEDESWAQRVVILSWDYWQRRYGGAPMLGEQVVINGGEFEVVGIMPRGADLPQTRVSVLTPTWLDPAEPPVSNHHLPGIARLRAGVTLQDARAELDALTARFPEHFPEVYSAEFMEQFGFRTTLQPLHEQVVGPGIRRALWVLLGAVGLVLLIACANVASLYLVRLETRQREVALRAALGADRRNLAAHFLGESLLVGAAAAATGVLLAFAGARALVRLAPDNFPRLADVGLTAGAVWLALSIGALAAIAFGLLPVLGHRLRTEILREGGRARGASPRRNAVRAMLVVAQTALALVLLASAGLMLRSYHSLSRTDLGIEPRDVLTFQVTMWGSRYPDSESVFTFHRELVGRLEALPGVVAAGTSGMLPLRYEGSCSGVYIEGRPLRPGEEPPCVGHTNISPGVFAALGSRVYGETPGWTDIANRAAGVVVTRAFADRYWPGLDPIGRGLRPDDGGPPYYRVTGVAENIRARGVDQPPTELIFYPLLPIEGVALWSARRFANVFVRTAGVPPLALVPQIRATIAELDRTVPVANVQTLETVVARSDSMARASFTMLLLLIAGTVALLLSAVGIYGVIAYVTGQRTSEIGLRMALGAQAGQVKRLVVRQSLAVVTAGVLLGLAAAIAGTRVLRTLLFEVSPTDPLVLASAAAVLLGVAAAASYIPARRAARIEPMQVLRAD